MKIDVVFRKGGRLVDGPSSRPVRLLPARVHAGVVYGGVVYPLRVGNVVNLLDASQPEVDWGRLRLRGRRLATSADRRIAGATLKPARLRAILVRSLTSTK